ncbi:MAG: hypothetical protein AAGJ81_14895 [Verrucomicrobiota bacterium]
MRFSLIVLSLWLLVGPTALLQLTAWGWMIASYSTQDGFQTALTDTFSGERPCELCQFVRDVSEAPEETNAVSSSETREIKLLPVPNLRRLTDQPNRSFSNVQLELLTHPKVSHDVPRPPPRVG